MSRSRSEELITDALALLHAHGFTPSISENGGKHTKIRWVDAGQRFTLVVSFTGDRLPAIRARR
jgi:hypothetical protein